ncbi:uncharacterized protein L199_007344 [Kwoniella botswanensis]|uniref:uncharacterized protein n=1 Tax=Kwoniella botswanensis TaxID=1268659 RepID=UPI00315C579A
MSSSKVVSIRNGKRTPEISELKSCGTPASKITITVDLSHLHEDTAYKSTTLKRSERTPQRDPSDLSIRILHTARNRFFRRVYQVDYTSTISQSLVMGQSVNISRSVEQLFRTKTDGCKLCSSSANADINKVYELWCNKVTVIYESTNGLVSCDDALHIQAAPPSLIMVKSTNNEADITSLKRFPGKYREALAEIQNSGAWKLYCEGCEAEGHAILHSDVVIPPSLADTFNKLSPIVWRRDTT